MASYILKNLKKEFQLIKKENYLVKKESYPRKKRELPMSQIQSVYDDLVKLAEELEQHPECAKHVLELTGALTTLNSLLSGQVKLEGKVKLEG